MRQLTVILVTAVLTATATAFSMMAISSNPVRPGADVDANSPIDVMKMMRNAKNLPTESYPAH
jgi:hypothetical protein